MEKSMVVDVIQCKDCVFYDGSCCRTNEFVQYTFHNGRKIWKVTDHDVDPDDYCSFAEEGYYEPWGFPGENLSRIEPIDPDRSVEPEPELEEFIGMTE